MILTRPVECVRGGRTWEAAVVTHGRLVEVHGARLAGSGVVKFLAQSTVRIYNEQCREMRIWFVKLH